MGINEKILFADVLVIGGGMAGFFAAIKAKEKGLDVIMVDKAYPGKSGSTHFSEGDLTFLAPQDKSNIDEWLEQISRDSEYLNNRQWGRIFLEDSYDRYQDLNSWGVQFYQHDGEPFVGHFGAHKHCMMMHREYAPTLRRKALDVGVRVMDRIMVNELIKQDDAVVGAVGFHTRSGNVYIFEVKAIVMATGGTSMKAVAKPTHYWTGDGEMMAYKAGAELTGKEFLFDAGSISSFRADIRANTEIHELPAENIADNLARHPSFRGALMGSWAIPSLDAEGKRMTMLAWEAHCGRAPLYINFEDTPADRMERYKHFFARMGTIELEKIDFNPLKLGKAEFSPGRLEVGQSIHAGGGIVPVDEYCASSVSGLYAAGNCFASLVSGASYAGMGIGLCSAAVTGARAGLGAADYAMKNKSSVKIDKSEIQRVKKIVCAPVERVGGFSPAWATQMLQGYIMPYFILHIKHAERLSPTLSFIEFINRHIMPKLIARDPHEWRLAQETKNMALNAEMNLRASLFREESRGSHFREDYPRRMDPDWLAWVKIKNNNGEMQLIKQPIPEEWWPDLSKSYEELYPRMFPGE
jgi:succinate dehydrogenase/fumarate reductase flavoprotein subunit